MTEKIENPGPIEGIGSRSRSVTVRSVTDDADNNGVDRKSNWEDCGGGCTRCGIHWTGNEPEEHRKGCRSDDERVHRQAWGVEMGTKTEMEQRKLSLEFIAFRAELFVVLCSALKPFGNIHANWVPSKYHPEFPDPYLSFELNGTEFVIGSRKRVFEIYVIFPDERDVSEIQNLALDDNVTYIGDDNYKGRSDGRAKKVLVHAWGSVKLNEYLEIVMGLAGVRKL